MKSNATLNRILIILAIALFVCLLMDFMALHDIHNDYVSKQVIDRLSPSTRGVLPDWTDTPGEWSLINLSMLVKLIAIGFTFFVTIALRANIFKSE